MPAASTIVCKSAAVPVIVVAVEVTSPVEYPSIVLRVLAAAVVSLTLIVAEPIPLGTVPV